MRLIDADELLKQIDEWLSWDIKFQREKPPVTIPNKWLKGIKAVVNHKCDTINAIVIPKNATNGDVIKAMFPDVKIMWITQTKIDVTFMNNQDYITELDAKWWNAPYKGARS